MPDVPPTSQEIDIIGMPATGLAAYWLSLKKLMDERKNGKVVLEEMASVTEPTIRHLLDATFGSSLPEEVLRRMFAARRQLVLGELRHKLDCMTRTLSAMVAGENPLRVLSLATALYPQPPVREGELMEAVYAMVEQVRRGDAEESRLAAVDHSLKPAALLARLMYCLVVVRREGREASRRLAGASRSPFFAEGLSLVADGFEERFLARRLALHRRAILGETARKLHMAEELCLGIKARYSYEDLWRLARTYLPG